MQKEESTYQPKMKNLTKTLTMLAVGLISCALFSQQAQAATIRGQIDFTGSVTFDTTSLATANEVSTWYNAFGASGLSTVTLATGDFSGIALGSNATMATPWIFNPSTATPGLWSVGGFTFDLASSTIVSQSSTFLNISGTGTISGNGFDATPGTWAFSTQNASGGPQSKFSFSATTTAPDGGSAVALLGIALAGIEGARRIVRARKA